MLKIENTVITISNDKSFYFIKKSKFMKVSIGGKVID